MESVIHVLAKQTYSPDLWRDGSDPLMLFISILSSAIGITDSLYLRASALLRDRGINRAPFEWKTEVSEILQSDAAVAAVPLKYLPGSQLVQLSTAIIPDPV
jgi:hypothetical protein